MGFTGGVVFGWMLAAAAMMRWQPATWWGVLLHVLVTAYVLYRLVAGLVAGRTSEARALVGLHLLGLALAGAALQVAWRATFFQVLALWELCLWGAWPIVVWAASSGWIRRRERTRSKAAVRRRHRKAARAARKAS